MICPKTKVLELEVHILGTNRFLYPAGVTSGVSSSSVAVGLWQALHGRICLRTFLYDDITFDDCPSIICHFCLFFVCVVLSWSCFVVSVQKTHIHHSSLFFLLFLIQRS